MPCLHRTTALSIGSNSSIQSLFKFAFFIIYPNKAKNNKFEEQLLNPNCEIREITSPKASSFFEIETIVECFDK